MNGNSNNGIICVIQKEDHSVSFYDINSNTEIKRIRVGNYPHEMIYSPSRLKAYCTLYGVPRIESPGLGGNEIAILDVQGFMLTNTLQTLAASRPHGVAIDERNGFLYSTCEHPSTVLRFALNDLSIPASSFVLSGSAAHNISLSEEGNIACISLTKSNTVQLIRSIPNWETIGIYKVSSRPEGSIYCDGLFFVGNREADEISVIHPQDGVISKIAAPGGPVRICNGPNKCILVAMYHSREIVCIDTKTLIVTSKLALSFQPVSIYYDPLLNFCFLATLANNVCVVNVKEMRLVSVIPTRAGPDAIFKI